jgi:hypothetical protein
LQIAEKDIQVRKLLKVRASGEIYSPFQGHLYFSKRSKKKSVELRVKTLPITTIV